MRFALKKWTPEQEKKYLAQGGYIKDGRLYTPTLGYSEPVPERLEREACEYDARKGNY